MLSNRINYNNSLVTIWSQDKNWILWWFFFLFPTPTPTPPTPKTKKPEVHYFWLRFSTMATNMSGTGFMSQDGPTRARWVSGKTSWAPAGESQMLRPANPKASLTLRNLITVSGSGGRARTKIMCISLRLANQRRFKTQANLIADLFFRDIPEVIFSPAPPLMPYTHTFLWMSNIPFYMNLLQWCC